MILCNNFSYRVNETAARVLNYVAWSVNRFSAQDLIKGGEPLIEEKLRTIKNSSLTDTQNGNR